MQYVKLIKYIKKKKKNWNAVNIAHFFKFYVWLFVLKNFLYKISSYFFFFYFQKINQQSIKVRLKYTKIKVTNNNKMMMTMMMIFIIIIVTNADKKHLFYLNYLLFGTCCNHIPFVFTNNFTYIHTYLEMCEYIYR